jgi:uncharacterized protein YceH (UPF0502 family)
MDIVLSDKEGRVLGSLIEKELSTPDYYPLSLNALTNACNQKSSRDPVVSYMEQTVEEVVDDLTQKGLAHKSRVGRVPKVEERFTHDHNLVPRESAILCVLLLRGPQTGSEIKGRTARLYSFDSLDEVHRPWDILRNTALLDASRGSPAAGESRYTHLLCGEPEIAEVMTAPAPGHGVAVESKRMEKMEQDIEALRNDLAELKKEFQEFKKQLE